MVFLRNSKNSNIDNYSENNIYTKSNNNIMTDMYGGGPVVNQEFCLHNPSSIAINNTGYVFVVYSTNHCIHIFSPYPMYTLIYTIATPGISGATNNTFNIPTGVAIHQVGDQNILYVADTDNHRIQVFRITIDGNNRITPLHLPGQLGSPHSIGTGSPGITINTFDCPSTVAIHRSGNDDILYVADTGNHRIQMFRITINNHNNTINAVHLAGRLLSRHSIGPDYLSNNYYLLNFPCGVAIHRIGDKDMLYIADSGNHRIQVFSITINDNNTITATHIPRKNVSHHSIGAGRSGITNNAFHHPTGVAIHLFGNEEILYVVDTSNCRIQLFNQNRSNVAAIQYYDTISHINTSAMLTHYSNIPLHLRNTSCIFCNLHICTPIPKNSYNNVNGYVVKRGTDNPNYFHYRCIYDYMIMLRIQNITKSGFLTRGDASRIMFYSHNNNNFEGTDFFIPDFIILNRETDVPGNIIDTPCSLCGLRLCIRVIDSTNNTNGYVVYLHNVTQPNTYYYHYKCLYTYFIQIMLSGSAYKSPHCATVLDRDDIDKLLNIDGKSDALIGNRFYN